MMNVRSVNRLPLFVALLVGTVTGCGRYAPPVPPEALSPRSVADLAVEPQLASISFRWRSPSEDVRGKELKSIDGYKIYRKELVEPSDLLDPEVKDTVIGNVADTHIRELERLRDEARARGGLVRSVKVPPELTQFAYQDDTVVAGKTYAYRIVPFHEGGVEGQVGKIIRVAFRGNRSDVSLIALDDSKEFKEPNSPE